MDNISPLNFDKDSFFIIDLRIKNYESLCLKIGDISNLSQNDIEISILDDIIANFQNNNNFTDKSDETKIIPKYLEALKKFRPGICIINNKINTIIEIIQSSQNRENINIRNIQRKYKKKTNETIGKTSIYYIMKNKLNYKYLKTVPKTIKLKEKSSKIRTFIFIKIIARALSLKMTIIYLDESNFQLENNNLRVWRKSNETPYFKSLNRGRKNIILAITDEKILLYKINKGTNNSSDFLEFMKNLVESLRYENFKII